MPARQPEPAHDKICQFAESGRWLRKGLVVVQELERGPVTALPHRSRDGRNKRESDGLPSEDCSMLSHHDHLASRAAMNLWRATRLAGGGLPSCRDSGEQFSRLANLDFSALNQSIDYSLEMLGRRVCARGDASRVQAHVA